MAEITTTNAHVVNLERLPRIEILGPTIQFVTSPDDGSAPCVMRGTIPPGEVVPLHSHADPETFLMLSGTVEGLAYADDDSFRWVPIRIGEVFHVPGGARHAFRNQFASPAVMLIMTTSTIGCFFRELGTPVAAGVSKPRMPSEATIRRFQETSARYGYWNATPEENARVGLTLPLP